LQAWLLPEVVKAEDTKKEWEDQGASIRSAGMGKRNPSQADSQEALRFRF